MKIMGKINWVDINEFSKHTQVNQNIVEQAKHVMWECPCGEINVIVDDLNKGFKNCACDNCQSVHMIGWRYEE